MIIKMVEKIKSLFETPKQKRMRVIDPENLEGFSMLGEKAGKNFKKYKKVYSWPEIIQLGYRVKGKNVRYWRLVNCGSPFELNERWNKNRYIPIFYKKRKPKRKYKLQYKYGLLRVGRRSYIDPEEHQAPGQTNWRPTVWKFKKYKRKKTKRRKNRRRRK